ncbi:hypothetical protein SAMN05421820_107163 [Pedobacter steynii]|uniref:Uncharacterized protein n=2 Tax=Pedobacter steynii TaxID=430522 RepID=A0A1H0APL1_9SPHI|nr:hypothetical protein SAMN05421820_107163 [Pedobacter steynii]
MNFFFEYIYYRITQLFFKRDGRTGFTGIAIISLMQALFIEVILLEIGKWIIMADTRALYAKQFGYIGAAIGLFFMIYNYKKYNGKYNQYRYYWKDETRGTRMLKGCYILLAFLFPIALVIIFGVHWEK